MVNGCDGEVKTYAHSSPSRSLRNSPSASPSHSFSGNSSLFHRPPTHQQQHNNGDFNATDVNGTSITTDTISKEQNGNNEVTNMVVDSATDNCQCPTNDNTIASITTNGKQQDDLMDTSDDIDHHQASSSTSTTVPVITNSHKGIILVTII